MDYDELLEAIKACGTEELKDILLEAGFASILIGHEGFKVVADEVKWRGDVGPVKPYVEQADKNLFHRSLHRTAEILDAKAGDFLDYVIKNTNIGEYPLTREEAVRSVYPTRMREGGT